MAASNDFLSEDQFQCSICLDIFTDPVSTPCGHTFCKACITRHWAGKLEYQCPLCNNKFNKELKLSINTTFREVVDSFKKHQATADATSPAKPGEVSCDLCPSNKIRASKTCLVCLASFCETHLEPHLRVAALQRHKLSNPVPNLEGRTCREHHRILEFLCLDDHMLVCALCTEHSDHDTVNLNEAYIDQRSHIWRRKRNIQQTKNKKNAKAQSKKKGNSGRIESVKANQMTESNCLPYHRNPQSFSNPYQCNLQNKDFSKVRETWEFYVTGHIGWDLAAFRESDFKMTFLPNWVRHCILRFTVRRNTQRIQLFVDYGNGLVLLYDPDNAILLHRFTGCGINEQILPCFIPSQSRLVKLVQSLSRRVRKMSGNSNVLFWCCCCFVITLISICIFHYLVIRSD